MNIRHVFLIFGTLCCCLMLLVSAVSALRLPEEGGGLLVHDMASNNKKFRTLPSYYPIVSRNPFGLIDPQKKDNIAELPKVSGKFRLVGTVAGENGAQGVAIIEKRGGEQGVFFEGDGVFGATLVSIRDKAVVLRRNSRLEVLVMEGENDLPRITAVSTDSAQVVQGGSLQRSQLAEVLKSPATLAREITLIPGKREGHSGLLVRQVRKDGMLSKLGLQRGDLLLSANGKPFSVKRGAARLLGLLNEDRVAVSILRGKKRQQLAITIQ